MSDVPTLGKIHTGRGPAGQITYAVAVTYPDEPVSIVQFVGSTYGGPVVMVHPSGVQTFVTDPGRFGKFGSEWVRRFFGPR
jgi:hypothetical protein